VKTTRSGPDPSSYKPSNSQWHRLFCRAFLPVTCRRMALFGRSRTGPNQRSPLRSRPAASAPPPGSAACGRLITVKGRCVLEKQHVFAVLTPRGILRIGRAQPFASWRRVLPLLCAAGAQEKFGRLLLKNRLLSRTDIFDSPGCDAAGRNVLILRISSC
jgi:hypothetical protein